MVSSKRAICLMIRYDKYILHLETGHAPGRFAGHEIQRFAELVSPQGAEGLLLDWDGWVPILSVPWDSFYLRCVAD